MVNETKMDNIKKRSHQIKYNTTYTLHKEKQQGRFFFSGAEY